MAITIDYGNIASAMQLGAQAGQSDAFKWRFGAEQQAQAGTRAQEQLDLQRQAQQIQQAMEQQKLGEQHSEFNVTNVRDYQQMQMQHEAAMAQAAGLSNYRQGILGLKGDANDIRENAANNTYEIAKAKQGTADKKFGLEETIAKHKADLDDSIMTLNDAKTQEIMSDPEKQAATMLQRRLANATAAYQAMPRQENEQYMMKLQDEAATMSAQLKARSTAAGKGWSQTAPNAAAPQQTGPAGQQAPAAQSIPDGTRATAKDGRSVVRQNGQWVVVQ